MSSPRDDTVVLTRGRVWEIMTEHGTRHLLDLRNPDGSVRRMRIPGEGRPEHRLDGRWQGRVGIVHHADESDPDEDGHYTHEVIIGMPFSVPGPGFGDWYQSTAVVAVRVLDEDQIPPVVGGVAYEPDSINDEDE